MTILQINKFFYLQGGSERYFFDVSAALATAGHTVVHFSMHHPKNQSSPYSQYFIDQIDFQGQASLAKAAHFLYSTGAAKRLERLINETRPDVAHLHNIAHQLTPSILRVLKKHHIPVVQTLHDYQLICPNYKLFTKGSPCERCHVTKYWNAISNQCVQDSAAASALSAAELALHNVLLHSYKRGVDRFITPSHFLYNKLVQWEWQPEQLHYLPHFVTKTPDPMIERKRQVLFAGRLVYEKGPHILLEAARLLEDADVRIVIAGSGPLEQDCRALIEKYQLRDVELVGFQSTAALDRLIQESAAVIVPSLWYENAPLAVYEALALGTPVIASDLGGLPELITAGETGYLFPAGDATQLAGAIQFLLMKPLHFSKNQYNIFNQTDHLKRLVDLYDELLHAQDS